VREVLFNYVLAPSMETSRDELPSIGELGKKKGGILKSIVKIVKTPFKPLRKIMPKIWRKTVPKAVRKPFTRKNFIKFAPILAVVAQVLNIIPGLGVAVGVAIMAGSAAITVALAIAKQKQMQAQALKSTKDANAQANASFDASKAYLVPTYGVTQAQFNAMSLDNKQAFLQTASDQAPQAAGLGYLPKTRFYTVPGLGTAPLTIPSKDEQDAAAAAKNANALADAAFDKSQGYFTEKYSVSDATFKAMTLDDKLNFLQVTAEDADVESKAGQGIFDVSTPDDAQPTTSAPAGAPEKPARTASSGTGLVTVGLGILLALVALRRESR
jgi:hypothetical protein